MNRLTLINNLRLLAATVFYVVIFGTSTSHAEELQELQVRSGNRTIQMLDDLNADNLNADNLNADNLNADNLNADNLNADNLNEMEITEPEEEIIGIQGIAEKKEGKKKKGKRKGKKKAKKKSKKQEAQKKEAQKKETVKSPQLTRLRVSNPKWVIKGGGKKTRLKRVIVRVNNVGDFTAQGVNVRYKVPGGPSIQLSGPSTLGPRKSARYSRRVDIKVVGRATLSARATCQNCHK